MNDSLFKAIMFANELKNITLLMVFYFIIIVISIILHLTTNGIESGISFFGDKKRSEFFSILFILIKRLMMIALFVISSLLLFPGTMLIFSNKFNIFSIISILMSIFTFIFYIVSVFISYKESEKIVSILLIISSVLFLVGNSNLF